MFVLLAMLMSPEQTYHNHHRGSKEEKSVTDSDLVLFQTNLTSDMVLIQGAQFTLGHLSKDAHAERDEKNKEIDFSQHSFYISKTEVTQKLYSSVMGKNPSKFQDPDNPVESISWYDAIVFCNRLSQQEGLTPVYQIQGVDISWDGKANGYRLLTEAEWEYAARAGKSTLYAGSSNSNDVAWTKENSNKRPHKTGQKNKNDFGLYDMSGNVYEWVWDWHQCTSKSFDKSKKCDGDYPTGSGLPTGWTEGTEKVFRGGSYANPQKSARVSNRGFYFPYYRSPKVGFRVARNNTTYSNTSSSLINYSCTKSKIKTTYDEYDNEIAYKITTSGKKKHIFEKSIECPEEGFCYGDWLGKAHDLDCHYAISRMSGDNENQQESLKFVHKITGLQSEMGEVGLQDYTWIEGYTPSPDNRYLVLIASSGEPYIEENAKKSQFLWDLRTLSLLNKTDISGNGCTVSWNSHLTYTIKCSSSNTKKTYNLPARSLEDSYMQSLRNPLNKNTSKFMWTTKEKYTRLSSKDRCRDEPVGPESFETELLPQHKNVQWFSVTEDFQEEMYIKEGSTEYIVQFFQWGCDRHGFTNIIVSKEKIDFEDTTSSIKKAFEWFRKAQKMNLYQRPQQIEGVVSILEKEILISGNMDICSTDSSNQNTISCHLYDEVEHHKLWITVDEYKNLIFKIEYREDLQ